MTDNVSCPYIDDADIDHRYVAGSLSPEQAEEFERHYFECDLCLARVKRAQEIRAAFTESTPVESTVPVTAIKPKRSAGFFIPLAAAAMVLIGISLSRRDRAPAETANTSTQPAMRGVNTSLAVSSHDSNDVLVAAWSRPAGATTYLVRLLAGDGALLFQRETTDTSIVISSDSLGVSAGTSAYWEIQALDELRKPIATSGLTPSRKPGNSP